MTDTFFNAASLPPAFLEDLNVVDNEYFSWENAEQIHDPNSISTDSSDSEQEEGTSELHEDKLVDEECREVNKVEEKLVADFLEKGCSCTFGPNKESCSKRLTKDLLLKSRAACFELSPTELDLVIMSQLQANIRTDDGVNRRKRYKPTYCYQGKPLHDQFTVSLPKFYQRKSKSSFLVSFLVSSSICNTHSVDEFPILLQRLFDNTIFVYPSTWFSFLVLTTQCKKII